MVRLSGIRHRYSAGAVLHGAKQVLALERFEAAAGEHWLVLGASGSGKTTLLNLIAGLLAPSEGTVEVGGQAHPALGGAGLARRRGPGVGILPEELPLV